MKKTVRIVLYILSGLTVVGLLAAFVLVGRNQSTMQEQQDLPSQASPAQGQEEQPQESQGEAIDENEIVPTELPMEETEEIQIEDTEGTVDREISEETTIVFSGDILFNEPFLANYNTEGINGVLDENLLMEMQNADILVVNNEFTFSDRGEPAADKQYTFRCAPEYVTALNEMGVDVASLANNHSIDYGKESLIDTMTTLENAGIRYAGAGETVERAQEVQIIEVNGKKFGFIAVSRVVPEASWKVETDPPGVFNCYDYTPLLELVEAASKECDFLAVYPHWGVERQDYPEDYQIQIAEKCIAAGADIIVGSHSHCLQDVDFINGKPVFYSLGNYIFGWSIDKTALLKVTVKDSGEVTCQVLPAYSKNAKTCLAEGEQAESILQYWNEISEGATINADGTVLDNE